MTNYDAKTELKNALFYLYKYDYRLEVYNENARGIMFNFFHLADVYNALIYCDFEGGMNTNLQYATPIKRATEHAEKAARSFIMLVNQGKRATAEKILAFFVEYSKKVFEAKFSINFDINYYNL